MISRFVRSENSAKATNIISIGQNWTNNLAIMHPTKAGMHAALQELHHINHTQ
jgi:hypothetical protein